MKKIKILGIAALMAAVFTGGQILAGNGLSVLTHAGAGEPGTSTDPVITESYMKQELGKLQTQINDLKKQIGGGSGSGGSGQTPPPSQNLGTATVTANSLNVRSTPSTSSSVVGSLSKGNKVTLLEKGNGWYKIQYGNVIGWASSSYLSISGSTTPPPTQVTKATVTANSLNVRSTASTSGSIVGSLKKGNVVEVLEKKSGWSRIKYGSITGWASADYLK